MTKQSTASGTLRPLLALHLFTVFCLAAGWSYYCWEHLPQLRARLMEGADFEVIGRLVELLMNDVMLGFATVALFAFGTGVYVHRAQQWIDGRGSGQAIALRGANLNEQAIAANPPSAKKR